MQQSFTYSQARRIERELAVSHGEHIAQLARETMTGIIRAEEAMYNAAERVKREADEVIALLDSGKYVSPQPSHAAEDLRDATNKRIFHFNVLNALVEQPRILQLIAENRR